jgi:quercetin dioxygenase-like cupin family protein
MALGRRLFTGCAICAAIGVATRDAGAQPAAARRTILQSAEVPGTDRVTHLVLVEFPANGGNPRHTHPGVTTGLVLEGELQLAIDGMPTATLKAGDSLLIPDARPHVEQAGAAGCKAVVSFTVEKGKPLASPA